MIFVLIKSFDFFDLRLLTSLRVSCTYNFTVKVYFGFKFEFSFVRVFITKVVSFFSLSCQVFLLTLFKVFERALIKLLLPSYVLAGCADIWLKCARVICIFKLRWSCPYAINFRTDLFLKTLRGIVIKSLSDCSCAKVVHIFDLGNFFRSLIDLWLEAIF